MKAKSCCAVLIALLTVFLSPKASAAGSAVGSLTLDTGSYRMAPGDIYDFRASVFGEGLSQFEVTAASSRDAVASVERVPGTDKYRVTGRHEGVCYISASLLGVRASFRLTVEAGAVPGGDSLRSVSLLHEEDLLPSVEVYVPDGVNVRELASLLEEHGICGEDELLAKARGNSFDGYPFLSAIQNPASRCYKLEGYLLPGSYVFRLGEGADSALRQLLDGTALKRMPDLELRAKIAGLTADRLLTLASLVQAESTGREDMYLVSSVLRNRLRNGAAHGVPRLELDSTVWYPYRDRADVPVYLAGTFTSMYDTNNFSGLPAGPICNPGEEAIDAALHPAATGYYYFCHSADGTGYYAKTAAEHHENLVRAGLVRP